MTYDPTLQDIATYANNTECLMDDQIQAVKDLSLNVAKFTESVDLYRVESDKSNKKMIRLTKSITWLTVLMLIGLCIQIYLAIKVK